MAPAQLHQVATSDTHEYLCAILSFLLLGQAGQAVEPAALIPLQMLAPKGSVVLVGDPQQLPATVLSRAARKAGLALSLFECLQQVPMSHAPSHVTGSSAAAAC